MEHCDPPHSVPIASPPMNSEEIMRYYPITKEARERRQHIAYTSNLQGRIDEAGQTARLDSHLRLLPCAEPICSPRADLQRCVTTPLRPDTAMQAGCQQTTRLHPPDILR